VIDDNLFYLFEYFLIIRHKVDLIINIKKNEII
jgi:hypothetical protein